VPHFNALAGSDPVPISLFFTTKSYTHYKIQARVGTRNDACYLSELSVVHHEISVALGKFMHRFLFKVEFVESVEMIEAYRFMKFFVVCLSSNIVPFGTLPIC